MRTKRRAIGEGTYRKRADGRWEHRVRLGVDSATGKERRQSVYADTREKCMEKAAKLRLRLDVVPVQRGTIAELLEQWITETVAPRLRPATLKQYDGIARKWIVPYVGAARLEQYGGRDAERLYRAAKSEGATARTLQLMHVVLHAAFKQALRWELLDRNPIALAEPPRYKAQKRRALTIDESLRLLAAAREHRLYGTVVLCLCAGMRPGEVFGLQWQHVDLKRGRLDVETTLDESRGTPELGDPKTATSKRNLVLPPIAVHAIEARRTLRLAEGNAASPYVFCDKNGGPLRKSNYIKDVWRPILESASLIEPRRTVPACRGRKAGLEPKRKRSDVRGQRAALRGQSVIHYHDLRHTYATLMKASGTDLHVLKELLGHTSITVTSDVYTHRDEGQHVAAARRSQDLFSEPKS